MAAEEFEVGDLVWAKMKNYPFWPAKIVNLPSNTKNIPSKKTQHYVFFFGTENYAWILNENIVHHSQEMLQSTSNKKKSGILKKAIKRIMDESEKIPIKRSSLIKEKDKNELCAKSPSFSKCEKKISKAERQKAKYEKAKKQYFERVQKASQNQYFAKIHKTVRKKYFRDRIHSSRLKETFNLELNSETFQGILSTFVGKPIQSTKKKIGFLGLGKMGQMIVKKLLESGHSLTVWNRSPDKCAKFVQLGAHCALTVCSVVAGCDVTFCCVSDQDAIKSIVFGHNGVLVGLEGTRGKGYVELSTLDPVICEEVAEAIRQKNGLYLEAPMTETRKEEEQSLAVICAGDYGLFRSCESCFHTFAPNAYYIGSMVGAGSNMNVLLNMFMNTVYAALGESMAMIRAAKLDQNAFLEFIKYGPLNCSLLQTKGKEMTSVKFFINKVFKSELRDLSFALELGDSYEQPMPLTSSANELYKHPRNLLYTRGRR